MLSYLILGVSRLTLAQVLPKQVCLQPPVVVYCFPYLGCGKVKQLLLVILGFFWMPWKSWGSSLSHSYLENPGEVLVCFGDFRLCLAKHRGVGVLLQFGESSSQPVYIIYLDYI
jgi:hypothetical protein